MCWGAVLAAACAQHADAPDAAARDAAGPAPSADAAPADDADAPADDAAAHAPDGGAAEDARPLDADAPAADAGPASDARPAADAAAPPAPRLPPLNGGLDYQLGGAYSPAAGVTIVSRDRNAAIAPGLYNICYVNGFQIQPDEVTDWMTNHPDLMLRDAAGDLVIDPDWNEILIDVRTPAQRQAVAAIVGDWIRGCRRAGFDAVEIDNLDTYSRSGGLIREADAVATMRLFADVAHAEGLAIAQKNSAELAGRRVELGTDFVVAEECNRYQECGTYTAEYGDRVLVIEYRRADFTRGCAAYPNLSIVLRDVDLVPRGQAGYVYDGC